jgi:hypothetical protein
LASDIGPCHAIIGLSRPHIYGKALVNTVFVFFLMKEEF